MNVDLEQNSSSAIFHQSYQELLFLKAHMHTYTKTINPVHISEGKTLRYTHKSNTHLEHRTLEALLVRQQRVGRCQDITGDCSYDKT